MELPALEVALRRQRRVADYLVAAAQVGARQSRSLDRERTCTAVQRAYCSRGPVRKCAYTAHNRTKLVESEADPG